MKSQKQFLTELIEFFKKTEIEYMISGSLGSSLHGEPRATNDVDLIIAPTLSQLNTFLSLISDNDYYVNNDTALEAFQNKLMFNIIDKKTGWKADIIIRKNRPFSIKEFERRMHGTIFGIETFVVSPEDAILSKLEWAKKSNSTIQYKDALGILTIKENSIDKMYLKEWAHKLSLTQLLEQLFKDASHLL
ncbi:hypothetical protein ACFL1T_02715 [Chlamydiota bacterium]